MIALARRVPGDWWLFLAFLAFLVPARIIHTSKIRSMFVDGGYYTEVAQHVRDGEGLVSNVSLYHFGYETFPYPTSVYPLWPWMLGTMARLVDIEILGHWVPLALSFLAVVLAFLFGRRLWPDPLLSVPVPWLHAGHLFALALATHSEFVYFTSLPYTEGLCWVLMFGFLLRVASSGTTSARPGPSRPGSGSGCCTCRATSSWSRRWRPPRPTERGWSSARIGPRVALHAAIALSTVGLILFGWFLHIRTFVAHAGLGSLLRFDQNRANDLLQPVDVIVETTGPLHFLIDRIGGLFVAFDLISGAGYSPRSTRSSTPSSRRCPCSRSRSGRTGTSGSRGPAARRTPTGG